MFGYININKPELKFREYDEYRGFYCGLCKSLKEKYGNMGRITLSYDLTFLSMLLTGLYDSDTKREMCRCITHPVKKHIFITNEFSQYCADMNLLLSYEKFKDDWMDEKKITRKIAKELLQGKNNQVCLRYQDKIKVITNNMAKIHLAENENQENLDIVSGYFGNILGEIYVYKDDQFANDLRNMGFYMGKFIYIMDAYEDVYMDIENNNYNPLKKKSSKNDFEEYCREVLTMMIACSCKAFERLPVIENVDILRNILYSGIWTKYNIINRKRCEKHV